MDEIDSSNNIISKNEHQLTENVANKDTNNFNVSGQIPKGYKPKLDFEKVEVKPAYIQVGNGNLDKEKRGTYSMDYTEELLNMTAAEGFMFKLLMDNRINPTINFVDHPSLKVRKQYNAHARSNQTTIDNSTLSKTEKKYLTLAYKLLREKNIIVRTKRGHYIINPRLVISNYDWKDDERLYIEAVEKLTKTS